MCGIVGTTTPGKIEFLLAGVRHRGPDSEHTTFIGNWALGFARLSITGDHTDGAIASKEGNWLLFNGELFDYPKESCRTDTAYLMDSLHNTTDVFKTVKERICGQYAFAFWSERERSLYLGRDLFGERPLYYYIGGDGNLSFASEAKALLPLVSTSAVCRTDMSDFIETETWLGAEASAVSGVCCVPIGCVLKLSCQFGTWEEVARISLINECLESSAHPSTVNQVGEALYKAIWERSEHGNKEVGVYLSGGLDSSLIAMICRPKHVFTCVFDTAIGKRELELAAVTAKRIGAVHHIVRPTLTREAVSETVYFMDGPQGSVSAVADFALAKEASKYVKVVLGGQGADELFCGYFRDVLFYVDHLLCVRYPKYEPLMNYYFNRTEYGDINRFLHLLNRGCVPAEVKVWAHKLREKAHSILHFVSLMELTYTLPTLVQMNDRAAAHVGIEARSPFLDEGVVSNALALPDYEKIFLEGGRIISKKALRTIARGLVADEIIDCEEKCGLHVPIQLLFKVLGSAGRGEFDRVAYAAFCADVWRRVVEEGWRPLCALQ